VDEEWKIEKRKGSCASCSQPLAPGQDYVAALVDEGDRFARRDFCAACWPAQSPAAFYSFWKARVPVPEAGPKRANLEAAQETFDRLLSENSPDPSRRRLAFLLSLILLQRRRLKLLETTARDGLEVLRFERAADHAVLDVVNPGISDAEIESMKTEMDALLS
jgi:hypothetical protein